MKTISRLLGKVYCEPWLMLPEQHRIIQSRIEAHLMDDDEPDIDDAMEEDGKDEPYLRIGNGIALMQVEGIIGKRLSLLETLCGGYDLDDLAEALNGALKDSSIQKIVIDWNTPGGMATGVLEAGEMIANVDKTKPIISYCEMQCCSAGIWMATQGRALFASQSSATGSIGAYAAYLDRSDQLEEMGVKVNAISAGKYKLAGAPFKPMSKDERAMLQSKVDRLHAQFKSAVSSKRPNLPDDAMEGQVFDGKEAVDVGLVDGIYSNLPELIEDIS